ncbi:uncharacterized protein LOC125500955 [Athalia rosae]|uniref:uncharacterized protein LOC125500955 n=1 Tax=Athalia rosae TaxID=37344 RepID=UPI002033601E|nr:uncharacterized protein LOC125500955 [Athalia rosae]
MSRKPPSMVLFPSKNDEEATVSSRKPKKRYAVKPQSIVERFDKMANAHIDERDGGCSTDDETDNVLSQGHELNRRLPVKTVSRTLASSITGFDIAESIGMQHDELAEAVEKLIKAEETTRFTELVVAAEAAVAVAPPELAEEAALAVAHEYQTQNLSLIQEEIPGDTIIEVIGYVGIRRRKDAGSDNRCVG